MVASGFRCDRCQRPYHYNRQYLNVHHLSYDRMPYRELRSDLSLLCRRCHRIQHEDENFALGIGIEIDFFESVIEMDIGFEKVFWNLDKDV